MTWGQAVVSVLTAVILVVGTWITARFSRKTGEEANQAAASQARTVDWEAFSREQREWTEDMFAERDRRINALAQEVREVRSELDTFKSKYRVAVDYIKRIVRQLQNHVDPENIETPPKEILDDL